MLKSVALRKGVKGRSQWLYLSKLVLLAKWMSRRLFKRERERERERRLRAARVRTERAMD
jgi:hypothetical protein